jgi:hypothetical protein
MSLAFVMFLYCFSLAWAILNCLRLAGCSELNLEKLARGRDGTLDCQDSFLTLMQKSLRAPRNLRAPSKVSLASDPWPTPVLRTTDGLYCYFAEVVPRWFAWQ